MNALIIFLFYFAFGALTAYLAKRKGRNVIGWFLFGMLLFPVGIICVVFAKDLTMERTPAADDSLRINPGIPGSDTAGAGGDDLMGLVRDLEGGLGGTGAGSGSDSSYMPPVEEPLYTDPIEEQIDSYHELYKAGILTREEFEQKKAALLGSRG